MPSKEDSMRFAVDSAYSDRAVFDALASKCKVVRDSVGVRERLWDSALFLRRRCPLTWNKVAYYWKRLEDGHIELYTLYWKTWNMPKNVGKWNGFHDINLSKADVEKAKEFAADCGKVLAVLEDCVDQLHKVSTTWDTKHDCAMTSISCYNEDLPQYKFTMVTRAKSAWGSLATALYKHSVLADGEWDVETSNVEVDF